MATDSVTSICNRALQKVGGTAITSLTENSKNSRECQRLYDWARKALLGAHPWNFASAYAALPALAVTPPAITPPTNAGGQTLNVYQLPDDFIRLVRVQITVWSWLYFDDGQVEDTDYVIQNGAIITWVQAPLNIRYVQDFTNANKFDPIFQEALAAYMARELAEVLTQSNTKKNALSAEFKEIIAEARRKNAFDKPAGRVECDDYLRVRH